MIIESTITTIPQANIDTDMIIPAEYLKVIKKDGLGENLFSRVKEKEAFLHFKHNPEAQILVARDNFGCGSSREHAVWSLVDYGFKVVLAPSFANIFHNNSLKNSLLTIALPSEDIENLISMSEEGAVSLKVDLAEQQVVLPDGKIINFEIDSFRKKCLMEGLDDLDYLLKNSEEIKSFNSNQKTFFHVSQLQ